MATKTQTIYNGNIRPPLVTAVSPLRAETVGKVRQIFSALLLGLVVGAILVGLGSFLEWNWLRYGGYVVGLGLLIFEVVGKHEVYRCSCPCCGSDIGNPAETLLSPKDTKKKIACSSCFEWLISDGGSVRSFTEADITDEKGFESACIKDSVWPNECILCGAAPTRHLNARSLKLNPAMLLVGRISVSSARVTNIPYCSEHEDAVDVKVVNSKVHLVFETYAALRRYLCFNRLQAKRADATR